MGDIRKFTDDNIFGNDPEKRNPLQAIARDLSHAIWHFGSAIGNFANGQNDKAAQDLKRVGDHLGGENLKQIKISGGDFNGSSNDSGSDYSDSSY